MAATLIVFLSFLVYGVVAGGSGVGQGSTAPVPFPGTVPSSSYLPPPKPLVSSRPAAQSPGPAVHRPVDSGTAVNQATVSGPATSYLPPPRHAASKRPAQQASVPVHRTTAPKPANSKPAVHRTTASGPAAKHISSHSVASGRPISTSRHHGSHRTGASTASVSRTVGSHAPY